MSYWISSLKLDGIRGVNRETEVSLNQGLTVFHGSNGSGKSSILQAIEWCLTGSIPYMKGGDFAREDAIVNDFNELDRARVELLLKGPQDVRLSRSKKKTNSTVSKRYQIDLEADLTFQNDEAISYLTQLLNLNSDEIQRGKFLHQETIRDILNYKPTERSAVIEKLLGTYDIKEFNKSLDQREIKNQLKNIEYTISSLKRDRIQFIMNLRRNLNESKNNLTAKGYQENQLNQGWALKEIEELREVIDSIISEFNLETINHPDISSNVSSLIEANNRLREDVVTIDRKKMSLVNEKNSKKVTLTSLLEKYSSALEHFKDYETMDLDELKTLNQQLNDQIQANKLKITELQGTLTLLPTRIASYRSAKSSLEAESNKLDDLVKQYGSDQDIQKEIEALENEAQKISNDLKKYSGQQRIVNQAIELLQGSDIEKCPVCSQFINAESLVSELRAKVSSDISERINELNNLRSEKRSGVETLSNTLSKINRLRDSINKLDLQLSKAKNSLEEVAGKFTEDSELNKIQDELLTQASETQKTLHILQADFNASDEKIRQFNFLNKEISDTRTKLQLVLGEKIDGQKLIDRIKVIENNLIDEVDVLKDNMIIDDASRRSRKLTEVLDYLRDEERTENAEKELPALNEQLNELETRKASIQHLSGALATIGSILSKYQKETSLEQIKELELLMNEYYSAVMVHPYYRWIIIEIENEDPLQFSFRARSERESTYITTKFSAAQLNAAAISIFMSNSNLLAGNLPFISLDDPTQSMDSAHKEAFAKLIARLVDDFQVIVATEDDETRDYLKQYCLESTCYELGTPELDVIPDVDFITV